MLVLCSWPRTQDQLTREEVKLNPGDLQRQVWEGEDDVKGGCGCLSCRDLTHRKPADH